ncbi:hypothetical protein AVEN_107818-1 [Araneus ventricosus]|uniref:Uncharacterized protein n=1 Tax=Araneus ventricosus TaxID=182803 RepID=A0A4Y2IJM9_ARAVE|nr:hypothetical protein AVEN_107818-1 [Araneus ventricosus]
MILLLMKCVSVTFQRCILLKPCSNGAWLGQISSRSMFVLVDCGRWNSDSRAIPSGWLCKYLSSAGVNGCNGALMSELFTSTTQETTDKQQLTSPRATSIPPVPTTRNNANRGRNSWKDRPLESSLRNKLCFSL